MRFVTWFTRVTNARIAPERIKAGRGMSLPRAPRPRSARGLRAKTTVAMMILLFMILLACAAAGLVLGGLRAGLRAGLMTILLHAAGRGPGGLEDM